MAFWLKRGALAQSRADIDRDVCAAVEGILTDVEARRDAAVRELSIKFARWDRDSYRLSASEIQIAWTS